MATNEARKLSWHRATERAIINVYVRAKERQASSLSSSYSPVQVIDENEVRVVEKRIETLYRFDHVFGPECNEAKVCSVVSDPLVQTTLAGYNANLMIYGHSRSEGFDSTAKQTIDDLFTAINRLQSKCRVSLSYLQIHREKIYDLLKEPNNVELHLREHPVEGVIVEGLEQHIVTCRDDVIAKLEFALHGISAQTCDSSFVINSDGGTPTLKSSQCRAHLIAIITIEHLIEKCPSPNQCRDVTRNTNHDVELHPIGLCGKLFLCDLAGSERFQKEAADTHLKETRFINSSLLELGNVIHAIADSKQPHVPFRNSILTKLMKESLGGHSISNLMIYVSTARIDLRETKSSLNFGQRAMKASRQHGGHISGIDCKALSEYLNAKLIDLELAYEFERRALREVRREAEAGRKRGSESSRIPIFRKQSKDIGSENDERSESGVESDRDHNELSKTRVRQSMSTAREHASNVCETTDEAMSQIPVIETSSCRDEILPKSSKADERLRGAKPRTSVTVQREVDCGKITHRKIKSPSIECIEGEFDANANVIRGTPNTCIKIKKPGYQRRGSYESCLPIQSKRRENKAIRNSKSNQTKQGHAIKDRQDAKEEAYSCIQSNLKHLKEDNDLITPFLDHERSESHQLKPNERPTELSQTINEGQAWYQRCQEDGPTNEHIPQSCKLLQAIDLDQQIISESVNQKDENQTSAQKKRKSVIPENNKQSAQDCLEQASCVSTRHLESYGGQSLKNTDTCCPLYHHPVDGILAQNSQQLKHKEECAHASNQQYATTLDASVVNDHSSSNKVSSPNDALVPVRADQNLPRGVQPVKERKPSAQSTERLSQAPVLAISDFIKIHQPLADVKNVLDHPFTNKNQSHRDHQQKELNPVIQYVKLEAVETRTAAEFDRKREIPWAESVKFHLYHTEAEAEQQATFYPPTAKVQLYDVDKQNSKHVADYEGYHGHIEHYPVNSKNEIETNVHLIHQNTNKLRITQLDSDQSSTTEETRHSNSPIPDVNQTKPCFEDRSQQIYYDAEDERRTTEKISPSADQQKPCVASQLDCIYVEDEFRTEEANVSSRVDQSNPGFKDGSQQNYHDADDECRATGKISPSADQQKPCVASQLDCIYVEDEFRTEEANVSSRVDQSNPGFKDGSQQNYHDADDECRATGKISPSADQQKPCVASQLDCIYVEDEFRTEEANVSSRVDQSNPGFKDGSQQNYHDADDECRTTEKISPSADQQKPCVASQLDCIYVEDEFKTEEANVSSRVDQSNPGFKDGSQQNYHDAEDERRTTEKISASADQQKPSVASQLDCTYVEDEYRTEEANVSSRVDQSKPCFKDGSQQNYYDAEDERRITKKISPSADQQKPCVASQLDCTYVKDKFRTEEANVSSRVDQSKPCFKDGSQQNYYDAEDERRTKKKIFASAEQQKPCVASQLDCTYVEDEFRTEEANVSSRVDQSNPGFKNGSQQNYHDADDECRTTEKISPSADQQKPCVASQLDCTYVEDEFRTEESNVSSRVDQSKPWFEDGSQQNYHDAGDQYQIQEANFPSPYYNEKEKQPSQFLNNSAAVATSHDCELQMIKDDSKQSSLEWKVHNNDHHIIADVGAQVSTTGSSVEVLSLSENQMKIHPYYGSKQNDPLATKQPIDRAHSKGADVYTPNNLYCYQTFRADTSKPFQTQQILPVDYSQHSQCSIAGHDNHGDQVYCSEVCQLCRVYVDDDSSPTDSHKNLAEIFQPRELSTGNEPEDCVRPSILHGIGCENEFSASEPVGEPSMRHSPSSYINTLVEGLIDQPDCTYTPQQIGKNENRLASSQKNVLGVDLVKNDTSHNANSSKKQHAGLSSKAKVPSPKQQPHHSSSDNSRNNMENQRASHALSSESSQTFIQYELNTIPQPSDAKEEQQVIQGNSLKKYVLPNKAEKLQSRLPVGHASNSKYQRPRGGLETSTTQYSSLQTEKPKPIRSQLPKWKSEKQKIKNSGVSLMLKDSDSKTSNLQIEEDSTLLSVENRDLEGGLTERGCIPNLETFVIETATFLSSNNESSSTNNDLPPMEGTAVSKSYVAISSQDHSIASDHNSNADTEHRKTIEHQSGTSGNLTSPIPSNDDTLQYRTICQSSAKRNEKGEITHEEKYLQRFGTEGHKERDLLKQMQPRKVGNEGQQQKLKQKEMKHHSEGQLEMSTKQHVSHLEPEQQTQDAGNQLEQQRQQEKLKGDWQPEQQPKHPKQGQLLKGPLRCKQDDPLQTLRIDKEEDLPVPDVPTRTYKQKPYNLKRLSTSSIATFDEIREANIINAQDRMRQESSGEIEASLSVKEIPGNRLCSSYETAAKYPVKEWQLKDIGLRDDTEMIDVTAISDDLDRSFEGASDREEDRLVAFAYESSSVCSTDTEMELMKVANESCKIKEALSAVRQQYEQLLCELDTLPPSRQQPDTRGVMMTSSTELLDKTMECKQGLERDIVTARQQLALVQASRNDDRRKSLGYQSGSDLTATSKESDHFLGRVPSTADHATLSSSVGSTPQHLCDHSRSTMVERENRESVVVSSDQSDSGLINIDVINSPNTHHPRRRSNVVRRRSWSRPVGKGADHGLSPMQRRRRNELTRNGNEQLALSTIENAELRKELLLTKLEKTRLEALLSCLMMRDYPLDLEFQSQHGLSLSSIRGLTFQKQTLSSAVSADDVNSLCEGSISRRSPKKNLEARHSRHSRVISGGPYGIEEMSPLRTLRHLEGTTSANRNQPPRESFSPNRVSGYSIASSALYDVSALPSPAFSPISFYDRRSVASISSVTSRPIVPHTTPQAMTPSRDVMSRASISTTTTYSTKQEGSDNEDGNEKPKRKRDNTILRCFSFIKRKTRRNKSEDGDQSN